jgi:hypothetical protein
METTFNCPFSDEEINPFRESDPKAISKIEMHLTLQKVRGQ